MRKLSSGFITLLSILLMVFLLVTTVSCTREVVVTKPAETKIVEKPAETKIVEKPAETKVVEKRVGVLGAITTGVGTGNYTRLAAIGPVIEKYVGVPVRLVPTDSVVTVVGMLDAGVALFAMNTMSQSFQIETAGVECADKAVGPHKIRVIWNSPGVGHTLAVTTNSKYQKISDIKGARVSSIPSKGYLTDMVRGLMAHGGLTYADVKETPTAGWIENQQALLQGTVDVCICAPTTAIAYEMEASPLGVRFLPVPFADKEGWGRLNAILPTFGPHLQTQGIKAGVNVEMMAEPQNIFGLDTADADLVYQIAKTIDSKNSEYKDKEVTLPGYIAQNTLKILDAFYPNIYHPGTIKYFKEIGIWTIQHEAWNDTLLKWEASVQAAWTAAVRNADSGKITVSATNAQWTKMWEEARPKVPKH